MFLKFSKTKFNLIYAEIIWVLLTIFPKAHGEQQSYCAQQLVKRKTSIPTCSPFHSFNKESHKF